MDFSRYRNYIVPGSPLTFSDHLDYIHQLYFEVDNILPPITRDNFPPTEFQLWNFSILQEGLRQLLLYYRQRRMRLFHVTHRQCIPESHFREIIALTLMLLQHIQFWAAKVNLITAEFYPELIQ